MDVTVLQVAISLADIIVRFLRDAISRHDSIQTGIKEIQKSLGWINGRLTDADGVSSPSETMKAIIKNIRDLGNQIEDVLDDFMIEARHHVNNPTKSDRIKQGGHIFVWNKIGKKIDKIRDDANQIWSKCSTEFPGAITSGENLNEDQISAILEENEVLCIEENKQILIDQLSRINDSGGGGRRTISVVGPEGSGKTVLVNSVYNDHAVINSFDCRAWVCVSKSFKDRADEFYRCLLSRFRVRDQEHIPAAVALRKYLHGKRYIIVLDAASSVSEWNLIKNILPHTSNSRIIITTCDHKVAFTCSGSSGFTHHLSGYTTLEQSWRLFCWKAFGNKEGKCPDVLRHLSKKIVTRCDSLPRVISAVGSHLSTQPRMPSEWEKVIKDNLSEVIAYSGIFSRSYFCLPRKYKSCLLYFGMLPVDYPISKARLLRLWIAEGLVPFDETKSIEDIERDYLKVLIDASLVEATKKDCHGKVMKCKVLNSVRGFILLKAKEEEFASVVTESMYEDLPEDIRRLSFHDRSAIPSIRTAKSPQLPSVRSFFKFGKDKGFCSKQLEKTLSSFIRLKVLDLEGAPLMEIPDCVFRIKLLRYLNLRNTKVSAIPEKIRKLRYLVFLDLKNTQVTSLPDEIWSLQFLKHLLVSSTNLLGAEIVGKFVANISLQRLSVVQVSRSKDCDFFSQLKKLTKMEKLGLSSVRAGDGIPICSYIQDMQNLKTLSLKCSQRDMLDLDHIPINEKNLDCQLPIQCEREQTDQPTKGPSSVMI